MNEAMRAKIIDLLDRHADMVLATQRADGFPQATTVSFVHDGLTLYFGCGASSQKARNIDRDPKVSAAMSRPCESWSEIEGLSLAGLAQKVEDAGEVGKAGALMMEKFPKAIDYAPEDLSEMRYYRVDPIALSVLDYSKGFGHCELVEL